MCEDHKINIVTGGSELILLRMNLLFFATDRF